MKSIRPVAVVLFVTLSAGADEVDYTKSIEYKARNPCTNDHIRVTGRIHVVGSYRDAGDAYRFKGYVDFTDLRAQSLADNQTFRSVGVKDNGLKATIDVPSETDFTYAVQFEGPGKPFHTVVTFQFSINWIGGKDIEIKDVRTECPVRT